MDGFIGNWIGFLPFGPTIRRNLLIGNEFMEKPKKKWNKNVPSGADTDNSTMISRHLVLTCDTTDMNETKF